MIQNNIEIRLAGEADLDSLAQLAVEPQSYFSRCIQEQRTVIVAALQGSDVGYGVLNWRPRYCLYKKLNIPEIQDLNVVSEARQQGVATAMILYCEELTAEKGHEYIGISVGLHSGFGAAQRLYAKQGYVPDGSGVTYDREPVSAGEHRPVDDDLCLMMLKSL